MDITTMFIRKAKVVIYDDLPREWQSQAFYDYDESAWLDGIEFVMPAPSDTPGVDELFTLDELAPDPSGLCDVGLYYKKLNVSKTCYQQFGFQWADDGECVNIYLLTFNKEPKYKRQVTGAFGQMTKQDALRESRCLVSQIREATVPAVKQALQLRNKHLIAVMCKLTDTPEYWSHIEMYQRLYPEERL